MAWYMPPKREKCPGDGITTAGYGGGAALLTAS
jgi:hypothetical protein